MSKWVTKLGSLLSAKLYKLRPTGETQQRWGWDFSPSPEVTDIVFPAKECCAIAVLTVDPREQAMWVLLLLNIKSQELLSLAPNAIQTTCFSAEMCLKTQKIILFGLCSGNNLHPSTGGWQVNDERQTDRDTSIHSEGDCQPLGTFPVTASKHRRSLYPTFPSHHLWESTLPLLVTYTNTLALQHSLNLHSAKSEISTDRRQKSLHLAQLRLVSSTENLHLKGMPENQCLSLLNHGLSYTPVPSHVTEPIFSATRKSIIILRFKTMTGRVNNKGRQISRT